MAEEVELNKYKYVNSDVRSSEVLKSMRRKDDLVCEQCNFFVSMYPILVTVRDPYRCRINRCNYFM